MITVSIYNSLTAIIAPGMNNELQKHYKQSIPPKDSDTDLIIQLVHKTRTKWRPSSKTRPHSKHHEGI